MAATSQVQLQSQSQDLGALVRTLLANTDLTDVAPNSSVATLLEGISRSLFKLRVNALKILESTDLESLVGAALDKKAEAIKLPNGIGGFGRKPATQASGPIQIGSAFQKISSKLYAGKPAPFAGTTTVFVENASSFPLTGSIYLGRGTVDRFEGPIPYTSITNSGSFWVINLAVPLTKSHLLSDLVVVSQGGDRTVQSGTIVQIQANSQTAAVSFSTTVAVTIPDGEAVGTTSVVCTEFGEVGNALAGSINSFTNQPFSGATVTNPTSFQNGNSTESDEDLRQRIKNYPSTLSRGTASAILASILGATDPVSGQTVQSAVVLEPVEQGDVARVFIDNGEGLEPTFGAQPYELLLQSASGQERRFRAAQYPITPSVAAGTQSSPFAIQAGQSITVHVDNIVETYTITPANYQNLNGATAFEIVRDFNSQSNTIGFRTLNGGQQIVLIELSGTAETMRVEAGPLQAILGLPTSTLRPIFLYNNSIIQSFRGHTGTLETRPRNQWGLTAPDLADVIVKVDGVEQTITITDADFTAFQTNIATSTIGQFASVLSRKIAGVQFAVSGQVLVWSTWQQLSPSGSLEILPFRADGSPAGWVGDTKMWTPTTSGGVLKDIGATKDFKFNRFTGEIEFVKKPAAGSKIEVGSRTTRAFIASTETATGTYTLTAQPGSVGNPRMVVGFDGQFELRTSSVVPGDQIVPTRPDPSGAQNILRLTCNDIGVFRNALPGDWLYLIQDVSAVTWNAAVESLYRLKAVGIHGFATNQTYAGLTGATSTATVVTAATYHGKPTVRVTRVAHGLVTGDLISVTTATPIGGISSGNLSVTNTAVIVIDADHYQYVAGANATSDAVGTLDLVGTNVVTVTHPAHGFRSGAQINTTVSAGIGGISAGNLSVSAATITVVTANTYQYRAAAAATSTASGSINTIVYVADAWVEIELSDPQLTAWTPLLTVAQNLTINMVHLFGSTAQPQIIDFGPSLSTVTVDAVVALIDQAVSSGSVEKLTPQQFVLRSNDFSTGTVAVLAVVGNTTNLFATPATSVSIQSHIAHAASSHIQGAAPVIRQVVLPTVQSAGYATRTYMQTDRDLTDIVDTNPNPTIQSPATFVSVYPEGFEHVWATGRQAGLYGRVYNNQTTAPFTGLMRAVDAVGPAATSDTDQTNPQTLDRYSNFGLRLRDTPLNDHDKLVVEMDLDPTDNTVAIPMSKRATIQDINALSGGGSGQVISFRLQDPDDSDRPFFDPTSVYRAFDFTDFKLLTHSVGLYRESMIVDRALVLRSVDYAAPNQLRLSIQLAVVANQAVPAVTHTTDFYNAIGRLNLIVTLASGSAVAGASLTGGNYGVKATLVGTLYNWRFTAGPLNPAGQFIVGNTINVGGIGPLVGSYEIIASDHHVFATPVANTTITSAVVTVTQTAHGLQDGDLVDTVASSAIGGISAANLTRSGTAITYIDANTFSYVAGAVATSSAAGTLSSVTTGSVTAVTPGSGGLSPSATFSGAANPLSSWPLLGNTFVDVANAINAYLPANPVATAQAIGTLVASTPVAHPTYVAYPAGTPYAGSDMSGAFNWHSFAAKLSGSAGIWQYDSSTPSLNNIKATVQSADSIWPTPSEAAGTTYSPIGEEVVVVPTNARTTAAWLNFNAVSSLNLLAHIERIGDDDAIEVSSRKDGSLGGIHVTGVSANQIVSPVIGNATQSGDATQINILSADAKPMIRGGMVRLVNQLGSEILRSYRTTPTGASITSANSINPVNYFRPTNALKYIQVNSQTGRLIFLRNGIGPAQLEPLAALNTVQLANLGSGLVQVTGAQAGGPGGTGKLSARVGDLMYVQPLSPFAIDVQSKALPSGGITDGTAPEYLGYPVVHVIDDNNIIVLAPNVTTFSTVTLATATDVVFMPALWNEKNIRTNHQEGATFYNLIDNGNAWVLVKPIGSGLVGVWLQNSSTEATDTMLLAEMSVNTDDFVVLGEGFDPANQGTFRLVAHNGRNFMIVYNPAGGKDQVIDTQTLQSGGTGQRKWRTGPLNDGNVRPVRIIDSESVRLGDMLRISSPAVASQWFPPGMIGAWTITKIGYQGLDYTGDPLPHTTSDGVLSQAKITPYVDFQLPNAPISVNDSGGSPVDAFLIGSNDSSIGFVEGTPFSAIRLVSGHAVDAQDSVNQDVFLLPNRQSDKMTSTFGTLVTAMFKLGFAEQIFQGIDGYKIFSGLIQQSHRIIDGLPTNTVLFPGVKAAGAVVEVLPPLVRAVQVALQVRPKDGVTLNSITDIVKATVASYINGLGVGNPVVISEIISAVQALPGVFSVTVLSANPPATGDRIVVSDIEKAFVIDISKDVTVG